VKMRPLKPNTSSKHLYRNSSATDARLLLCPRCYEIISRDDIEHFSKCPFCDLTLPVDPELEDYILSPLVEEWTFQQGAMSQRQLHSSPFGRQNLLAEINFE